MRTSVASAQGHCLNRYVWFIPILDNTYILSSDAGNEILYVNSLQYIRGQLISVSQIYMNDRE